MKIKLVLSTCLCCVSAFSQAPFPSSPPSIQTGNTVAPAGACDAQRVGNIYVRSQDAQNAPVGMFRCTQTGPGQVYSWQPADHLVVANLPATCAIGDVAFLTTAGAGGNMYGCTPANTWTQVSGAGGAPAFNTVGAGTNPNHLVVSGSLATTGAGTIAATSVAGLSVATGKTLTANNSITLVGADGTTMTFPLTSQTIPGLSQTNTAASGFSLVIPTGASISPTGTGSVTMTSTLISPFSSLPATCTPGQLWSINDATTPSGLHTYECSATNKWFPVAQIPGLYVVDGVRYPAVGGIEAAATACVTTFGGGVGTCWINVNIPAVTLNAQPTGGQVPTLGALVPIHVDIGNTIVTVCDTGTGCAAPFTWFTGNTGSITGRGQTPASTASIGSNSIIRAGSGFSTVPTFDGTVKNFASSHTTPTVLTFGGSTGYTVRSTDCVASLSTNHNGCFELYVPQAGNGAAGATTGCLPGWYAVVSASTGANTWTLDQPISNGTTDCAAGIGQARLWMVGLGGTVAAPNANDMFASKIRNVTFDCQNMLGVVAVGNGTAQETGILDTFKDFDCPGGALVWTSPRAANNIVANGNSGSCSQAHGPAAANDCNVDQNTIVYRFDNVPDAMLYGHSTVNAVNTSGVNGLTAAETSTTATITLGTCTLSNCSNVAFPTKFAENLGPLGSPTAVQCSGFSDSKYNITAVLTAHTSTTFQFTAASGAGAATGGQCVILPTYHITVCGGDDQHCPGHGGRTTQTGGTLTTHLDIQHLHGENGYAALAIIGNNPVTGGSTCTPACFQNTPSRVSVHATNISSASTLLNNVVTQTTSGSNPVLPYMECIKFDSLLTAGTSMPMNDLYNGITTATAANPSSQYQWCPGQASYPIINASVNAFQAIGGVGGVPSIADSGGGCGTATITAGSTGISGQIVAGGAATACQVTITMPNNQTFPGGGWCSATGTLHNLAFVSSTAGTPNTGAATCTMSAAVITVGEKFIYTWYGHP